MIVATVGTAARRMVSSICKFITCKNCKVLTQTSTFEGIYVLSHQLRICMGTLISSGCHRFP